MENPVPAKIPLAKIPLAQRMILPPAAPSGPGNVHKGGGTLTRGILGVERTAQFFLATQGTTHRLLGIRPASRIWPILGWPRSTVEKGPQSNESYERENPWNRTISTVLWVHKKLPQSTVKLVLPSNESYESKTGCNRTLATVLWVPLKFGVPENASREQELSRHAVTVPNS